MEYSRFVVITDGMIYQTMNENDAHEFARQCPWGRVGFYEIPNEDLFGDFVEDVIESGEYLNHFMG